MRHTVERCFLDVSLHLSSFILCHMYKPQNIYSQLHKQTSKKPSVIQYKTDQTSSWIFLQHLEACYIIKQSTYVHNRHSTYVCVYMCKQWEVYWKMCFLGLSCVHFSYCVVLPQARVRAGLGERLSAVSWYMSWWVEICQFSHATSSLTFTVLHQLFPKCFSLAPPFGPTSIFSRTPYYKWQTCFCPLTLFENTFMYKGILLLTNLWYWYIIWRPIKHVCKQRLLSTTPSSTSMTPFVVPDPHIGNHCCTFPQRRTVFVTHIQKKILIF